MELNNPAINEESKASGTEPYEITNIFDSSNNYGDPRESEKFNYAVRSISDLYAQFIREIQKHDTCEGDAWQTMYEPNFAKFMNRYRESYSAEICMVRKENEIHDADAQARILALNTERTSLESAACERRFHLKSVAESYDFKIDDIPKELREQLIEWKNAYDESMARVANCKTEVAALISEIEARKNTLACLTSTCDLYREEIRRLTLNEQWRQAHTSVLDDDVTAGETRLDLKEEDIPTLQPVEPSHSTTRVPGE